jgi:hypothetical protein
MGLGWMPFSALRFASVEMMGMGGMVGLRWNKNRQQQRRNAGVSPLRFAPVEMTAFFCRSGRDDGFWGGRDNGFFGGEMMALWEFRVRIAAEEVAAAFWMGGRYTGFCS